jgi:hypothetical protein
VIHRRAAAVLLAVIMLLLGTAAPARAHATVALTVNNDGRGAVSVDVAWSDGHPVTEAVAGTLIAVSSAGAQVGPAPLSRTTGGSTVVYDGALPPGTWQVTVDLALPGLGHCVAEVFVAPGTEQPRPGTQRCGETKPPAAAPASPASPPSSVPVVLLFAVAAAIALGTATAILLRRRSST